MTPYTEKLLKGVLLRCLLREKATYVLNEVHAGVCDAHQAGPKLANQIKRLSYYWPTMIQDAIKFAKASLSNTWRFHPQPTKITPPKQIILALPCMGVRCDRIFQAILLSWSRIYSGSHRLFFKVG